MPASSGNSEKLAGDLAKAARKNGLKPTIIDMADLDLSALASAKRLVVIAATWGEGEPPARAVRAYNELMSEGAPRLDGVEFGVLALGDTAYAEFCAIGKKIDERLAALGGKRIIDRVDCDLDFAEPAARWIGDAVKALTPPNAGGRGHRGRFRRQAGSVAEHRYRRGRNHRACGSQLLTLGQGDRSSGAILRGRGSGL